MSSKACNFLVLLGVLSFFSQVFPCNLYGQDSKADAIPVIEPPIIGNGKQKISLPDIVDDVDVGGGGRYLALHFKLLRKIGIFDSSKLSIVGYIPVGDSDAKFAAGATKLLVVSGDSGTVARWDLATQKQELVSPIELGGSADFAALGAASSGPAIVGGAKRQPTNAPLQVDLETLKTTLFECKQGLPGFGLKTNLRISADGHVMTSWSSRVSPTGMHAYIKTRNGWTGRSKHDSTGYLVPSPDGKRIYTCKGIYTNQLQRLDEANDQGYSIPALQGPCYLYLPDSKIGFRGKANSKVFLKIDGDNRPLAQIANFEQMLTHEDRGARQRLTLDKRLFLIPDARMILQLDNSKQQIVAVEFDIEKALRESTVDYLIVLSRPPRDIKAGDTLKYQIETKSRKGGVTYSLDAGPKGMSISPTGLLTWQTTSDSPATNGVIITVGDKSGQNAFHSFTLTVKGGNDRDATGVVSIPATSSKAKTIDVKPTEMKEESREFMLPGIVHDVVVGGKGRFLFFHLSDLKMIAVFDTFHARIAGYLPANDENTLIAAGATKALVFSTNRGIVTRYRLDTLQRDLSVAIPFSHPVRSVGMGVGSEGPVLLHVDNSKGRIVSPALYFLDINTLKPIPVDWPQSGQPHLRHGEKNVIRASANGEVFVVQGIGALRLHGNSVQMFGSRMTKPEFPSADGRHFFSYGRPLNANAQPMGDSSTHFGSVIPSVTGPFFLSFVQPLYTQNPKSNKHNAKLYLFGDNRPLVTIKDLVFSEVSHTTATLLGWRKRVFYIPDENLIVTMPSTNDRIYLRRFCVNDALKASGTDFLAVVSNAPPYAPIGKRYEYKITVMSKRGGVKYSLDSAPDGMAISTDGEITWIVPENISEGDHRVIVSVSDDSGQSIFHTFTVIVPEVMQKIAAQRDREKQERLAKSGSEGKVAERREDVIERRPAMHRSGPAVRVPRPFHGETKSSTPPARKTTSKESFRANMRTWKDSSGKYRIEAKFVEIIDKKTVVLLLENGITRKIPLSKLSDEDIYEAVKSDILKRKANRPHAVKSPMQ